MLPRGEFPIAIHSLSELQSAPIVVQEHVRKPEIAENQR